MDEGGTKRIQREKRTSVAVTRTSVSRNVERPRWLVRLDNSKSAIGHDKYRSQGIKSAADLRGKRVRRGDPREVSAVWLSNYFLFYPSFLLSPSRVFLSASSWTAAAAASFLLAVILECRYRGKESDNYRCLRRLLTD